MSLSRELLEKEITAAETAIKQFEISAELHKIVLEAFKKELSKIPEDEKKPKA